MDWEKACKSSDSSIAVRIADGIKIYRSSFGAWYLTPHFFERINLNEDVVEGFLDWRPF